MSILWTVTLLLVLISMTEGHRDPFTTLVNYELKQRKTTGVESSKYHLLPLRLTGQQQHFLQTPTTEEVVIAEAIVHWITPNSSLKFPEFDLSQKVRITIEEETLSSAPAKNVFSR